MIVVDFKLRLLAPFRTNTVGVDDLSGVRILALANAGGVSVDFK